MSEATEQFIVGPTTLTLYAEALSIFPELRGPQGDTWPDAWIDGEDVYIFGDDPALAGGLAQTIAELSDALTTLTAGSIANTPNDEEARCAASITVHSMNADGDSVADNSVTLTYARKVDDLAGVLDLEMGAILEMGDALRRLVPDV